MWSIKHNNKIEGGSVYEPKHVARNTTDTSNKFESCV